MSDEDKDRLWFQHAAARRRLDRPFSEPKRERYSFNTQPPEGGWSMGQTFIQEMVSFNTQPPEGGWLTYWK